MKLFALFLCLSSAITTVQSMDGYPRNRMDVEDNSGVREIIGGRADDENVMEGERRRRCQESMQRLYEYTDAFRGANGQKINYANLFTDRFLQKLRAMKQDAKIYNNYRRDICDSDGDVLSTRNYIDDAIFAITGENNTQWRYYQSFQPFNHLPNKFGNSITVGGRSIDPEMGQVLGIVYHYVENPQFCENAEDNASANLLSALIRNIGQCVEDDGHLVCNTGKSQRTVGTLQGYISGIAITADVDITTGHVDNPPEGFVLEVKNILTHHTENLDPNHPIYKLAILNTLHRNANKNTILRYFSEIIDAWKAEAESVYRRHPRELRTALAGLSEIYKQYETQINEARPDNEPTVRGMNFNFIQTAEAAKPNGGNQALRTATEVPLSVKLQILLDGAKSTNDTVVRTQSLYEPKVRPAQEKFFKAQKHLFFAQRIVCGDSAPADEIVALLTQEHKLSEIETQGLRSAFSNFERDFDAYSEDFQQRISCLSGPKVEEMIANEFDTKLRLAHRSTEEYNFIKEVLSVLNCFAKSAKKTYELSEDLRRNQNIPAGWKNRILTRIQQKAETTYAMINASKMDYEDRLAELRQIYIPVHEKAQKESLIGELAYYNRNQYQEKLAILERDAQRKHSAEATSRVTKFTEAWELSRTFLAEIAVLAPPSLRNMSSLAEFTNEKHKLELAYVSPREYNTRIETFQRMIQGAHTPEEKTKLLEQKARLEENWMFSRSYLAEVVSAGQSSRNINSLSELGTQISERQRQIIRNREGAFERALSELKNKETTIVNVVRDAIREQEQIVASEIIVQMLNELFDLSRASVESVTDFCREKGKLASDLDTEGEG